MLRRQLAGTSAKIAVGSNRGEVGNALLKKLGRGMCFDSSGMNKGELSGFKSDRICVAILDDGMQVGHVALGWLI